MYGLPFIMPGPAVARPRQRPRQRGADLQRQRGISGIAGFDPKWPSSLTRVTRGRVLRSDLRGRDQAVRSVHLQYRDSTIACINGSGLHTEFALLCDITLCAEHAELFDPHFKFNLVPGDGQGLTFQELMGSACRLLLYTSDKINAQMAKEMGLVNEVLPLARLLPRAWEIAEKIMQKPRAIRRNDQCGATAAVEAAVGRRSGVPYRA